MNRSGRISVPLTLFTGAGVDGESRPLRIGGFPANIHIWTALEFADLKEKPSDALPFSCGVWAALRFE